MMFDKDFDRGDEADGQTSTGLGGHAGADRRCENGGDGACLGAQPPHLCSSLGSASLGSASLFTPPPEVVALVTWLKALGWQAEALPAYADGQLSEQVAEASHAVPFVPWHRSTVVADVLAPQTGMIARTLTRDSTRDSMRDSTLDRWWIAARPQWRAVADAAGGTGASLHDAERHAADDGEEWDVLLATHWAQRLRPPHASHRRPSWMPPTDGW